MINLRLEINSRQKTPNSIFKLKSILKIKLIMHVSNSFVLIQ